MPYNVYIAPMFCSHHMHIFMKSYFQTICSFSKFILNNFTEYNNVQRDEKIMTDQNGIRTQALLRATMAYVMYDWAIWLLIFNLVWPTRLNPQQLTYPCFGSWAGTQIGRGCQVCGRTPIGSPCDCSPTELMSGGWAPLKKQAEREWNKRYIQLKYFKQGEESRLIIKAQEMKIQRNYV